MSPLGSWGVATLRVYPPIGPFLLLRSYSPKAGSVARTAVCCLSPMSRLVSTGCKIVQEPQGGVQ